MEFIKRLFGYVQENSEMPDANEVPEIGIDECMDIPLLNGELFFQNSCKNKLETEIEKTASEYVDLDEYIESNKLHIDNNNDDLLINVNDSNCDDFEDYIHRHIVLQNNATTEPMNSSNTYTELGTHYKPIGKNYKPLDHNSGDDYSLISELPFLPVNFDANVVKKETVDRSIYTDIGIDDHKSESDDNKFPKSKISLFLMNDKADNLAISDAVADNLNIDKDFNKVEGAIQIIEYVIDVPLELSDNLIENLATNEAVNLDQDINEKNGIQKIDDGEIISISSDENTAEVFEIDEASEDSYHSSDFEFISENEAMQAGLLINNKNKRFTKTKEQNRSYHNNFNNDNVNKIYRLNKDKFLAAKDALRKNHIIPVGEDYVKLFEGNNERLYSQQVLFLENKCVGPTVTANFHYRGLGFGMKPQINDFESNDDIKDSEETKKIILSMYPTENRKPRRRI